MLKAEATASSLQWGHGRCAEDTRSLNPSTGVDASRPTGDRNTRAILAPSQSSFTAPQRRGARPVLQSSTPKLVVGTPGSFDCPLSS